MKYIIEADGREPEQRKYFEKCARAHVYRVILESIEGDIMDRVDPASELLPRLLQDIRSETLMAAWEPALTLRLEFNRQRDPWALDKFETAINGPRFYRAITAIKEALEQNENCGESEALELIELINKEITALKLEGTL